MLTFPENPEARAPGAGVAAEMLAVYRLYACMAREMDPETGLGGKLLYAGEPDAAVCRLLRAANIAGAASLAASADAPALRRAMHEGAIDFVVNSLDEALRILKNEIRKKQPVAVGLTVAPESILKEMAERGVQPDLLAPDAPALPDAQHPQSGAGVGEIAEFLARGARRIEAQPLPADKRFDFVSIPHDWKQPASAFDVRLLDRMAPGDHLNRRWVRLAPRYLPAAWRRLRLVVE